MPDAKKVEKKALKVVPPLNGIAAWQYVSPFEENGASRQSTARKANRGFFDALQQTAAGTAETLGKSGKTIIRDRDILKANIEAIRENFDDYEKPFKKSETTEKLASLLSEVNAVNIYWKDLVKEMNK
jgi:hypothetical protein